MLTDWQKSEFDEHGWLRLPGAIPEEDIQIVLDRIWDDLEQRCGIPRGEPENWPEARPKGFNLLTRAGVFEPACNQAVQDAVDDLIGSGHWEKPTPWGSLLLTFPGNGPWYLPNHSWHMDLLAGVHAAADKTPGVQVFVVLEPLSAQGGATIGLSGSHRLVRHLAQDTQLIGRGRSADIRKGVKKAVPSLRGLWSHDSGGDREERYLINPVDVFGIPVQAVEFTGDPGDVIFMHSWILHTASANCGKRPRIVVTERNYKIERDVDDAT